MRRLPKNVDRGESDRQLPFWLFVTAGGPGGDPYPAEEDGPTVYYAQFVGQASYPKEAGGGALSKTNLPSNDWVYYAGEYLEEGTPVICGFYNGQWHVLRIVLGVELLVAAHGRIGANPNWYRASGWAPSIITQQWTLVDSISTGSNSCAIAGRNEIYIARNTTGGITKVTRSGATVWHNDGVAGVAAAHVATDAEGGVYLSELSLRKFDPDDGSLIWATAYPVGVGACPIVVGPDGFIYSLQNVRIRKYDPTTGAEVVGGGFPANTSANGVGSAGGSLQRSIAAHANGNLFCAVFEGAAVFNLDCISPAGAILWTIDDFAEGGGAKTVAVDANGNRYVTDDNVIRKYDSADPPALEWEVDMGTTANFGACVDSAGNFYFFTAVGKAIVKLDPNGNELYRSTDNFPSPDLTFSGNHMDLDVYPGRVPHF